MAMPTSHWHFDSFLPTDTFYHKILFHMDFARPHNNFITQFQSHLCLEFLTLCQGFCSCLLLSFQLGLQNLVLCVFPLEKTQRNATFSVLQFCSLFLLLDASCCFIGCGLEVWTKTLLPLSELMVTSYIFETNLNHCGDRPKNPHHYTSGCPK